MSIHASLAAPKGRKQRSVLNGYERIEKLKEEGKWTEETSSFGLPKIKVVKMKLKKVKSAEAKGDEAKPAEGTAAKTASK